ncbi:hypothetical protein [Micromonospora costi]|uniref:Uncharacterized protein n=1 Tax=Micromonospora costi TaxID=1530042 RepID=A0A3A9ZQJ8_9ACTN|nr:hypothetical protein [Micromonospora costi]RKN50224.1 hypothetical protein D7193_30750 [Micromonospora costi]
MARTSRRYVAAGVSGGRSTPRRVHGCASTAAQRSNTAWTPDPPVSIPTKRINGGPDQAATSSSVNTFRSTGASSRSGGLTGDRG